MDVVQFIEDGGRFSLRLHRNPACLEGCRSPETGSDIDSACHKTRPSIANCCDATCKKTPRHCSNNIPAVGRLRGSNSSMLRINPAIIPPELPGTKPSCSITTSERQSSCLACFSGFRPVNSTAAEQHHLQWNFPFPADELQCLGKTHLYIESR